jgi:uncharacterized damage-inducible protein DinB
MGPLESFAQYRAMTAELLATLDDDSLAFTPGPSMGPMWQQFRHLGRVEDNYVAAIATGRIAFGPPRRRSAGSTATALAEYLRDVDADLAAAVASAAPGATIDWGGHPVDLPEHAARLVSHELLHQGELVVYVRLLGRPFPRGWRIWGL